MHSFASALSCAFAIVIASVPTLAVGFPADHRVRDVGPKVEARDTPPAGAPDNVTGPFYGRYDGDDQPLCVRTRHVHHELSLQQF